VQVGRSRAPDPAVAAAAIWVALHGLAQLRETASLFPWPDGLEEEIVTRLARLD